VVPIELPWRSIAPMHALAPCAVSLNRWGLVEIYRLVPARCTGRSQQADVRRYPARATNLLGQCFGDDRLGALRLQVRVGKAQNLKTAGISDDPEI
jgi:hypothetical protein